MFSPVFTGLSFILISTIANINWKFKMSSIFVPPKGGYGNTCNPLCITPPIDLPQCEPLCDPYTFGSFRSPATVYTYYNYPDIISNIGSKCSKDCNKSYLQNELVYSIYQIIDGVEHYVGNWVIKNKDTPNKKEFAECGEYILRYCSKPPSECYPECEHPIPPVFHISKTSCCDCCFGSYIDSSTGESEPDFEYFNEFVIRVPPCCTIDVEVEFESHVDNFTLLAEQAAYTFDSGKFCELIKSIKFNGSQKCIEKLHVIVKR